MAQNRIHRGVVFLWHDVTPGYRLSAFDAANGKRLWFWETEESLSTRVVYGQLLSAVTQDIVMVGTGVAPSSLHAFATRTGEPLWDTNLGGTLYELMDDGVNAVALIASLDRPGFELLTLDLSDGKMSGRLELDRSQLVSERDTPDRSYQPVMLKSERYLFYSGDGGIYQFNAGTGRLRHSLPNLSGNLALIHDTLYLVTSTKVRAFDAETLKPRWLFDYAETYPQNEGGLGLPLVKDEGIYLLFSQSFSESPQGYLFKLSSGGELQWRASVPEPATVTGNDSGLFMRGDRALYAYSDMGALRWRFPMFPRGTSTGVSDSLVFSTDRSPRYRNWLAYFNPSWH